MEKESLKIAADQNAAASGINDKLTAGKTSSATTEKEAVTVIANLRNPVITIVRQPVQATNVTEGDIKGSLSVKASVTLDAKLSYQWYASRSASGIGGIAVSGATEAIFVIPAELKAGVYHYYCNVSATGGAATVRSNVVQVTVTPATTAPIITSHPADSLVAEGGSTTFTVVASGTAPLSYEWQYSFDGTTWTNVSSGMAGSLYLDEDTATLKINADLSINRVQFRCIVTNPVGSVYSKAATITINITQFFVGGIYYKLISGTNVKVTNKGYDDNGNLASQNSYSGAVNVPATVIYGGVTYYVKQIGPSAFRGSTGPTSITLANGITTFESAAFFGCPSLLSLNIPASLTNMGTETFVNCNKLTLTADAGGLFSVANDVLFKKSGSNEQYSLVWIAEKKTGSYAIPSGVVEISDRAIYVSNLSTITIPASVTNIKSMNFFYCTSLENITLLWDNPSSCAVDASQFTSTNKGAITLHVPSSAAMPLYQAHPVWGSGFKLAVIAAHFSVGGIYYKLISGIDVKVTNQVYSDNGAGFAESYSGVVTVPATVVYGGVTYMVKEIGKNAFRASTGLTSVILSNGITAIDGGAFIDCSSLQTLHIPASITSIGQGNISTPFYGCTNLTLTVASGGKFSVTGDVLFESNGGNPQHYLRWIAEKKTGSYTLPNGVAVISDQAICKNKLTEINILASVTRIASWNFCNCTLLTHITLPWIDPASCAIGGNQFESTNKGNIILHVPAVSIIPLYQSHPVWGGGFKAIVTP